MGEEELEAYNRAYDLTHARAHEPFAASLERMEKTKRPGASRLLSWILHPDERVPAALVTRHSERMRIGAAEEIALHELFLHRALEDQEKEHLSWTPLLQIYAACSFPARTHPSSSGQEKATLPLARFGHETTLTPDISLRFPGGPEGINEKKYPELRRWIARIRPGEEQPNSREQFGEVTAHFARAILESAQGDGEVLQETAERLPSPYLWTLVGRAFRMKHQEGRGAETPEPDAMGALLAKHAGYPPAFFEPPPSFTSSSLDLQETTITRYARSQLTHLRMAFRHVVPEAVRDQERASEEPATPTASPRRGRRQTLAELASLLRLRKRELTPPRVREKPPPNYAEGTPPASNQQELHAYPIAMAGILPAEEVGRLTELIRSRWQERGQPGVDTFEAALELAGTDVTDAHLDRLMDVATSSRADTGRRLWFLLWHPAASPELFRSILGASLSPHLRSAMATTPKIREAPDVVERLAASTIPETLKALAETVEGADIPASTRRKIIRGLTRSAPRYAFSLLDSEPLYAQGLRPSDLAPFLTSEDAYVRERVIELTGEVAAPQKKRAASRRP